LNRISIEWANALGDMGHEVVVSVPRINHIDYHWWLFQQNWIKGSRSTAIFYLLRDTGVKRFFRAWSGYEISNISSKINVNRFVLKATNLNMPDSDYIIAMNGVYLVPNILYLSSKKGEVISSIHMNYGQAIIDTDKSVVEWNKFQIALEKSVNVRRFVESTKNLEECRLLDIPVNGVIPPGINLKQFHPRKDWGEELQLLRIALFCHPRSHKGLSDGIKVVEKIKRKYSSYAIVFSTLGDVGDFDVSMFDHHFGYLLKDEYPKALRGIDILIYPELFGGFSVPPLHAMASGCAVALNEIDGTEIYALNKVNCMVSNPGDINKMAKNVGTLIENSRLRNEIQKNSLQSVGHLDWYNSAKILIKFLNKEEAL
jgi:glycosyltransferase involved in cell wall biosynthesis